MLNRLRVAILALLGICHECMAKDKQYLEQLNEHLKTLEHKRKLMVDYHDTIQQMIGLNDQLYESQKAHQETVRSKIVLLEQMLAMHEENRLLKEQLIAAQTDNAYLARLLIVLMSTVRVRAVSISALLEDRK